MHIEFHLDGIVITKRIIYLYVRHNSEIIGKRTINNVIYFIINIGGLMLLCSLFGRYYGSTKCKWISYNSFFTGEIQEDACECPMLLIEIMHKGFGPCPTNDNINSKGSFSELLFSFVLDKYTICDICTMKSPAFETTSLLYVTPTDSSSMQELLMQGHKQKSYKTWSCCGRDTWHIESKQILQPPNFLIIIVNRITYSNNRISKNKSRMPLD